MVTELISNDFVILCSKYEAKRMEARVRIELTHKGFADLSLTTWVPRPMTQTVNSCPKVGVAVSRNHDN